MDISNDCLILRVVASRCARSHKRLNSIAAECSTPFSPGSVQRHSHFLSHFVQWRTTRPWCFLFSMHQLDSACIDSMVLDTPWNRRSKDASRPALEPRAPCPLAAPEPAAIFTAMSAGGSRCRCARGRDRYERERKHAHMFMPLYHERITVFTSGRHRIQHEIYEVV